MTGGQVVAQIDPSGWGESLGQLVTALGGAVVVREIVKQVFARQRDGDQNATLARADLRQQVADLITRMDTMQARLDVAEEKNRTLFTLNADLRSENVALRSRYHRFMNYVQELMGTIEVYHHRLGLPESELPRIPRWLDETVPGPTAQQAAEMPPEAGS